MKIYKECSLTDFEPWSGGADRFRVFTCEQLETIEQELEVLCPDGMSETEINDLFWFDENLLATWLGFDDFDALERHNNEEEEEV